MFKGLMAAFENVTSNVIVVLVCLLAIFKPIQSQVNTDGNAASGTQLLPSHSEVKSDKTGQATAAPQLFANIRLTANSAESVNPRAVVDNEFLYVVWEDTRDGNREVYWQKFDLDNVAPITEPIRVTSTPDPSFLPSIGIDAVGNSYLAWQEGSLYGTIFAAKLNSVGTTVIAPMSVSPGLSLHPDIAAAPDGTNWIVYQRMANVSDQQVYIRKGNSSLSQVCLAPMSNTIWGAEKTPVVATDGTNGWVAHYDLGDFFAEYLRLRRYVPPCTVSGQADQNQKYLNPALGSGASGIWAAAERDGAIYQILGPNSVMKVSDLIGTSTHPRVEPDITYGYFVWQDNRNGNDDIYVSRAMGATDYPDEPITTHAGSSQNPDIATPLSGDPGKWWAVWQDNRDGNWEIYLAAPAIAPTPVITVDTSRITFSFTRYYDAPDPVKFTISNSGSDILQWQTSSNLDWLTISPSSGTGNFDTIAVSVSTTDVPEGLYTGSISVQSNNASNSPVLMECIVSVDRREFNPQVDGWGFGNTRDNVWPFQWLPWMSWDERGCADFPNPSPWSQVYPSWEVFRRALGQSQVENAAGDRLPNAERYWKDNRYDCPSEHGGWCYGFCVSSLMYLNNYRRTVAQDFPGNTTLFEVEADEQSSEPRKMIGAYWLYQFGETQTQYRRSQFSKSPMETFEQCKIMLALARDSAAFILLDGFATADGDSASHAVNPIRCEDDANNTTLHYIVTYDNLKPGVYDTVKIDASVVPNRVSFLENGKTWIRGDGYGLYLSNPIADYKDTAGILLNDPPALADQTRSTSESIRIWYSGVASLRIASDSGFFGFVGDSIIAPPDGIDPYTSFGLGSVIPIGYSLPNQRLSIEVAPSDSDCSFSVYTDNTVLGIDCGGLATFSFEYLGDDKTLRLLDSAQNRLETFQNIELIEVSADSQLAIQLQLLNSVHADTTKIALESNTTFSLLNYGEAMVGRLRARLVTKYRSSDFVNYGLSIPANTACRVNFDWLVHNDSIMVELDPGFSGHFVDTLWIMDQPQCGDCDNSGRVDITDVVFLIQYIFAGGPAPNPISVGDVDCDTKIRITDAVYLINYIFAGGPAPCTTCP